MAPLLAIGSRLYGTSERGGKNDAGTVFSLDAATGADKVLHSFGGPPDGDYPVSGLTELNGVLYGTTVHGGATGHGSALNSCKASGCGTVFAVEP